MVSDKLPGENGGETTLGPLVRNVGHLVRNKLAVLVNSTYYLRLRLVDADEKVDRHLNLMGREVDVASAVVADLMDFVMVKEPARRPLDVNQLVSDMLSELARPDAVEIVSELMLGLPLVEVDPAQIARALEKLLVNAVEAMSSASASAERSIKAPVRLPAGGRLTVRTGLGNNGKAVCIIVSDTGPGISAEVQDRLFDPLFTTKPQGFGLGLPIARGFVERHGGSLEVWSNPEEGTICTIVLPLSSRRMGER
jgi:signal transduction histidine kinase